MIDSADRKYMKQALSLAEKAIGLSSPNPSVGCLIVKNNKIIGRGWHEYDRLDHAEVLALREAGPDARDAAAYVTLEPCCHQGRTPPCAGKLIAAGIRRVVVARVDPNPLVSGKGIAQLQSAGIQVDAGLMEEEAGKIIEAFACHVTHRIPLVAAKAGMTLDGKIGSGSPEGRNISSPEGLEFGQELRCRYDALLVGVKTVILDDPALTYRGQLPKARPLTRIILDTALQTPATARLFTAEPYLPALIFCGPDAPVERRRLLEKSGAEIIPVPYAEEIGIDIPSVLKELGRRKILGVLVEGGSRVHWSFVAEKCVDLFHFIVSPMILGGDHAIPSVGGKGYAAAAAAPRFRIRKTWQAGTDMIYEAYPSYSRSIVSPWKAI